MRTALKLLIFIILGLSFFALLRFLWGKKRQLPYRHSKIYDIKSGEPLLDDDQFMDAMLDQISRYGEESLTPAEKKRMKEISEKKK